MAALGAEIMMPSHGAPIFGAERIHQALTETAEWLESIVEQTLNLLNEGRRLDEPASPLRAEIPAGYGDFGFQSSALIFPTPGCWEVTGHVGTASLTFVTLVHRIGEGPSTRAAATR